MSVLWPFYEVFAALLRLAGCRVFEDLSAICDWGSLGVPW